MRLHGTDVRVSIDAPAADETISSVLDRAAAFWRVERLTLAAELGFGAGDEDLDAPSKRSRHALANATGFSIDVLNGLEISSGPDWLHSECRSAYCPRCWKEDVQQGRSPYFRRTWASCAALSCTNHACLLYAWETDRTGRRRPPPQREQSNRSGTLWLEDLIHAESSKELRSLDSLAAFASRAQSAFQERTPWPTNWRGCVATGRSLMNLLAKNPSPYPERLAMDRLVPDCGDFRWFAGHSRAAEPIHALNIEPIAQIGSPALRRTAWWLTARTLVPGWAPMPIRGHYGVCGDVRSWWARFVGNAISTHARREYHQLGTALGLGSEGTGDLFPT